MKGKNILIIGSQGFIGKNIVEKLSEDNNLVLFDRDFSQLNTAVLNLSNVKFVEGNLSAYELIENTITINRIDIVIHLVSSLIPSSESSDFFNEFQEVIEPTYKLLNYLCKKKIKVIFFSSGGTIYGETNENLITEKHVSEPINYYGYSKLLIENYIQYLHRTNGLTYVIIRPSNVYGKYQRLDRKQGFIAVAIGKIIANKAVEIFGDGETIRDYIDVTDLALVISKLVKQDIKNKVLNVGSGVGVSLNEILTHLQSIIHKDIIIINKNNRKVDVDKVILDIRELKKNINFEPKEIGQGIKDFLSYIRENNE
ncbi:NAD-dependent epimerase/dehydratase family protein [Vibrio rumoiensis]|uniref:NAD-dependent epimerase/dehydratase domain-containing protein n=1 Tax=Vibrio rumoiensis 1S-45 TaxID=1188252 RepID=A0A1E5E640_9VIBR|nr:NAD-dependent epimerase/dehydratase family protein [Vibrio rumoiensis]OEF29491.1 hypothetical protein A1QC_04405 [Vibrio rumoiensis 1S-45]